MKLKELHLLGFKSFPEKTVVKFSKGITAILGPNGCGKTNILDALRWVLGEQSLSLIRCVKNEELIFAGTKKLPPLNFCEVKLILEDEEGSFMSEIEIKRRYFRTGESEYYINRQPCRLKDIEELFFQTGSRAYSLFSLADMRRIIHGEVRQFFWEAANLKKYQENKKEACAKLELTERDLQRLSDIIRERERIVRSLKRQKRRWEIYEGVRAEERRLRLSELAVKKKSLEERRKEISCVVEELAAKEGEIIREEERLEREIKEAKELIKDAEERQELLTKEILSLRGELSSSNAAVIKLTEKLSSLKEAQERLIKERCGLQITSHHPPSGQEGGDYEKRIKGLAEKEKRMEREIEAKRIEIKNLEREITLCEAAQEKEERERALYFDAIMKLHSEILKKEAYLANLEGSVMSDEETRMREELHKIFGKNNILGEVFHFLEVKEGYEKAVEAAIFPYYSFYLLRDGSFSPKPLTREVGFILQKDPPNPPLLPKETRGDLSSPSLLHYCSLMTGCPEFIASLLSETFLVEDYNEARRLAKEFPTLSFVTKDGILIRKEEVIFIAGKSKRIDLEQEVEGLKAEILKKREEKTRMENLKREKEEKISQLREEIHTLKELEKEMLARSSALIVEMGRIREERKKLETEFQFIQKELVEAKTREKEISSQLADVTKRIGILEEDLRLAEEKEREVREKVAVKEAEIRKVDLSALRQRKEELEEALRQKRQELETIRAGIAEKRMEALLLEKEKEDIKKEAALHFGVDIEKEGIEIIEGVAEKLKACEAKLLNIGKVNPLAREEYEREKEELDRFLKERADCQEAKENLEKTIQEIDKRLTEDFLATFEKVRLAFQEMFTRLFIEGEGDLLLSDPENPLESEITIIARPQGKNPKRLEQLSDGEKALLSLSLLFAFYKVKPAPFFFMDEVDAPLDDANVERFATFLREISKNTQVVIITHNRLTLEKVDVLLGVTAEEPGVSKIITMRLADLDSHK